MSYGVPIEERFVFGPDGIDKAYLLYQFPRDKSLISKLSLDHKIEWYGHQFQAMDPRQVAIIFSSKEFASFWKWRYLMPIKLKRFFYRVNNFEIFKKYPHISEMRPKARKHGI